MLLAYNKGPRILKSLIEVNKDKGQDPAQISFNFKVQYKIDDDNPGTIHVYLGFEAGDDTAPFVAELRTETLFKIKTKKDKQPSSKDLVKAVYLEAGTMIFPMINEYFNDLCRKAKLPMIDLPPIDFQAFYSANKDKIKKIAE